MWLGTRNWLGQNTTCWDSNKQKLLMDWTWNKIFNIEPNIIWTDWGLSKWNRTKCSSITLVLLQILANTGTTLISLLSLKLLLVFIYRYRKYWRGCHWGGWMTLWWGWVPSNEVFCISMEYSTGAKRPPKAICRS